MPHWLEGFLDSKSLSPHGICLFWRPELVVTHAISDLVIGLAYFSIPLALGVFLYHRRDVRFGWAILMFVAFIMLCGVTHFMMIWTLWRPDYGVEALIKAATATASIVTAVALWPLLPRAIALPSTASLQQRIDERDAALAELQATMASMVRLEELQSEQARLLAQTEDAEARFRSIFENAAVGIARVGLDGRFLEVNTRFSEIAGWSIEELLEGGFQRITHPDDLAADLAQVEELLAGVRSRYAIEKRYVGKDGRPVWVRLSASIVRDERGEADHFVAVIEDISEEKRARDSRDLLMREVDHRARNALAVVQSVVRLTAAPDTETFKKAVIGRVDALARAQTSLARGSWDGADLDEVARDELVSSGVSPSQWTVAGPAIALPPEQVQAFGMIVHELLTNAMKSGALSRASGHVSVRCSARGDDGWRVVWEETGGPAVSPPRSLGFGSRLMRRLADELNGRIDFAWKETGLQVEIEGASARRPDHAHPFIGAVSRLKREREPETGQPS